MRRSATPVAGAPIALGRLAVLVAAVALAGCQGATGPASGSPGPSSASTATPGPSASSTATATAPAAPPPVHRFVAAPDGSRFEVPTTDSRLAGLRIAIPPGALAAETEVTISVGETAPSVAALTEADPALFFALADFLMARLPPGDAHPMYTPLLAVGTGQLVGPPLELGPDGLAFDVPARILLPASLAGDVGDDLVVAALRSSNGTWEIRDVTVTNEGLEAAIPHFSGARFVQIAQNIAGNPSASVDPEWLAAAQARLGQAPLAATERSILRLLACEGQGLVKVDESKLPASLTDVLNYLGRDVNEIGDLNVGEVIAGLEQYVEARRPPTVPGGPTRQPMHFVTMEALVEEALRLTKLDAFQALVAVHGVLRDNRRQEGQAGNPFQDALELLRGDGGDEDGARYHYFGAAIYSFVYEHQKDVVARLAAESPLDLVSRMRNAAVSFVTPDPETTVRVEEAWISGDIFSDVTEYAVDLQGAAFGRALYEHFTAVGAGRESPVAASLCRSMEGQFDLAATSAAADMSAEGAASFAKLVTENRIQLELKKAQAQSTAPIEVTGEFAITLELPGEFFWGIHEGIGGQVFGASPEPMPSTWASCVVASRMTGTLEGQLTTAGGYRVTGLAKVSVMPSKRGCEAMGADEPKLGKPATLTKVKWDASGDEATLRGRITVPGTGGDASWAWIFVVDKR